LKPEQPETKKNEQADKQEISLTIRESMPSVQKTETQQSITFGHTEMKTVQNQPTEEKPKQPEITELKKKEEVSLSNAADEKQFFVPRTTLRETASTNGDDNADHQKRAEERIKKLKELSLKLKTPGGLAELEREPAYVRRKTELKDPPPNTGQQTARSTLYSDDDKNTDIRSNNSYLHDNVD
jgi:cell division protein FtsZ